GSLDSAKRTPKSRSGGGVAASATRLSGCFALERLSHLADVRSDRRGVRAFRYAQTLRRDSSGERGEWGKTPLPAVRHHARQLEDLLRHRGFQLWRRDLRAALDRMVSPASRK